MVGRWLAEHALGSDFMDAGGPEMGARYELLARRTRVPPSITSVLDDLLAGGSVAADAPISSESGERHVASTAGVGSVLSTGLLVAPTTPRKLDEGDG